MLPAVLSDSCGYVGGCGLLGRKHFAGDFPNPKREGCPAKSQLKLLAENPRQAKESVLDHNFVLLALLPNLQPLCADTESTAFIARE